MLGNAGQCFECGHEHAAGDRCLSFHFEPGFMEEVVAEVPGATRLGFAMPRLPPKPELTPLFAAAEAARDERDSAELEELALLVAGAATAYSGERAERAISPSARDERRITAAVRRIEAEADAPLSLAALAREAAMSPYHFLRTFRAVVGMAPHQFLIHTRLHRAAVRLRRTADSISAIAFGAGFGDLSTFNRRFRRVFGCSPRQFRDGA